MKYKSIVADPPWKLPEWGQRQRQRDPQQRTGLDYPTMTLSDICSMDISSAAGEGAHLYLWTVNSLLREAFDVIDAWGFTYLAPLHWIKPTGLGNWWVHLTQTVLFAYRPPLSMRVRHVENIFRAPVPRHHSRKPSTVHVLAEHISRAPRLELFARPPFRDGWDVWGNEAGDGPTQTILPKTVI